MRDGREAGTNSFGEEKKRQVGRHAHALTYTYIHTGLGFRVVTRGYSLNPNPQP